MQKGNGIRRVKRTSSIGILWVLLGFFIVLMSAPASAAEDRIGLGGGAFSFDETRGSNLAAEARLEYLSGWRLLDQEFGPPFQGIGPYAALDVNTDGGIFGVGGLFLDLRPAPDVYLRGFGGVGGYREGGARDLGGVFQFELGVGAGYRFANQLETGILFKHISNAGIHDENPGVNSIMLTVSVPTSRLLGGMGSD